MPHLAVATDVALPNRPLSASAKIASTQLPVPAAPTYGAKDADVPKPILARLPRGYGSPAPDGADDGAGADDDDGYESEPAEDSASDAASTDPSDGEPTAPVQSDATFGHIAAQPQGYLVHPSRDSVLYTRARLPDLGQTQADASHALWVALHALRPTVPPAQVAAGFWASLARPGEGGGGIPRNTDGEDNSTLTHVRRSFNWGQLDLPLEAEGVWYGVAFRSARTRTPPSTKAGTASSQSEPEQSAAQVTAALYAADRLAHEEAVTAGGLLMYWYAVPTEQGENLATCIWTSREAARSASRLSAHRHAAAVAAQAFEAFAITRYAVRKVPGETGVQIHPWSDADAANGPVGADAQAPPPPALVQRPTTAAPATAPPASDDGRQARDQTQRRV